MRLLERIARHGRITWQNLGVNGTPSPPFLILFVNSVCNLRCEHCFYWKNLNRRDDLNVEELFTLSDGLGKIDNLNLSGGEPFMRKELAEICCYFIRNNRVRQIYVPTNAYFTERIVCSVREILKEPSLRLFAVEISLDGMQEFHNRFRGSNCSFQKAMETYDALAEIQKEDFRLRIHVVSTVNTGNMEEVRRLSTHIYERCPAIDHHNIALIRGDRKNPSLEGPDLRAFEELHSHVKGLWAPRERGRYGGIVEPLLQHAKVRTAREKRQIVPCRAGVLSAVVYANGDVSFCETLDPLGNLRQRSFTEIWRSKNAEALRHSIRNRECYCTNEIFLWPSIVFQPYRLAKTILETNVWKRPQDSPRKEKEAEPARKGEGGN